LFKFTAYELDVARFSLVVDYSNVFQFWEMGMVKGDPDALSIVVRFSLCVFISNSVCNTVDERIESYCLIGCAVQRVEDSPTVFVPYCRQNPIGGDRSLSFCRPRRIVDPLQIGSPST
jgi:hypothetical protein